MDDMNELEIKGRIDGILTIGDESILIDIKTASDGAFKKVKSMGLPYAYKCQAQLYLDALGMDRMWFLYYNKNDSSRHILEYISSPDISESVRNRFSKVYNTTSELDLPDREFLPYRKKEKGKLNGEIVLDAHCAQCPFREKCYPDFTLNGGATHFTSDKTRYTGPVSK